MKCLVSFFLLLKWAIFPMLECTSCVCVFALQHMECGEAVNWHSVKFDTLCIHCHQKRTKIHMDIFRTLLDIDKCGVAHTATTPKHQRKWKKNFFFCGYFVTQLKPNIFTIKIRKLYWSVELFLGKIQINLNRILFGIYLEHKQQQ